MSTLSGATPAIKVEGVAQAYGAPDDALRVIALESASLEVARGELVCLIGPSGCGKSTLLNLMGGLAAPTSGKIWIDGEPVIGPLPQKVAFVFQENALFPWRTVLDNLKLGMAFQGVPQSERESRARESLAAVGLSDFANHHPGQLSGGMKQRAQLARALALRTEILLMDEPFAALDEQTRLLLGDKVLQIQQQLKQTTLLITHSITEAVQLADRILVMTYRPGQVKRVVDIDLPRPRTSEIVSSEAFGRYVAQIWSDLREEASRGMIDNESRALQTGDHRA